MWHPRRKTHDSGSVIMLVAPQAVEMVDRLLLIGWKVVSRTWDETNNWWVLRVTGTGYPPNSVIVPTYEQFVLEQPDGTISTHAFCTHVDVHPYPDDQSRTDNR